MYKIRKINNIEIKPVDKPKDTVNKKDIPGYDYFNLPFANIFICAKKNSGKTTLIYDILKNILNSELDQTVYFFVSTINNDVIYDKIIEVLKFNGIAFEKYDSLYDKEDGHNILDEYIKTWRTEPDTDKDNQTYPEKVFVFDDLSGEIKNNKIIDELMKSHRHFKTKIIVSSQYITDLVPSARTQVDYCLLFKNLSESNLQRIYESLDVWTETFEEFKNIYKVVTGAEPFNFLYIDRTKNIFRINFNTVIE